MPMKVYFGVRRQTRLLQGENTEMQDFTILSKPAQRWCTNKLHSEMSKSLYTQRYQTLDLKIFRLNFRAKQGKQFGLMAKPKSDQKVLNVPCFGGRTISFLVKFESSVLCTLEAYTLVANAGGRPFCQELGIGWVHWTVDIFNFSHF